jgi:hypothetical protein
MSVPWDSPDADVAGDVRQHMRDIENEPYDPFPPAPPLWKSVTVTRPDGSPLPEETE